MSLDILEQENAKDLFHKATSHVMTSENNRMTIMTEVCFTE